MNARMTDEVWIDVFIIELRLRRVPGAVIGDAVASVREFLRDSGESAEGAFGSAREYAASLELPVENPRLHALQIGFLPVSGFLGLMAFTLASSAWFTGNLLLVSVPQALLLAVPVILTVMLAFPFCMRAVIRHPWIAGALVVVAGVLTALSALLAPSTAAEAWLVISPLPLVIDTTVVLVILSIVGTIVTIRSKDGDAIIEPLPGPESARPRRGMRGFLILVNWIFPIGAAFIFAVTWGMSLRS